MHNEPQRAFIAPQRPEHISVETTRLSLTALKDADLDAVMAVFADKNSARMTHAIPHPLERGEAEALLTQMSATPFTHWAIRLDDEHLIGIISLTKSACGTSGGIHSFGPNLSVFIAPAYQGQGYAIEATDGLLRWCKKRKLHRIIHAAHFADNEASASALIKADFLYTGRRTMETSLAREGEHLALHMIRIL
ncbi:GNAT family N-acetyltransferase [Asticcacaulis sp.]|uniref:GNAT family N-acetyltransferase n=1 Tax=Asticcacaulis sp. TaxID=1872648 RepID=UPI002CE1D362|nr:GNAT family N-acetyltransferase [Asticcacaulis sp.]HTM80348.1 GNAT family N-acetyltransferase [Asticcacaulis sp.]